MYNDLRYALRMLRKNPGFTAVAVLTLALAIGMNTAIFSLIDAVLIRPLPYPEPQRLMMIWENAAYSGWPRQNPAVANYLDWKQQAQAFEEIAAFMWCTYGLTGTGQPEKIEGQRVTAGLFKVLGVEPTLGRIFTMEEDKWGGPSVAMISYGLWRRRFNGDASVIGKSIGLDGETVTIIGVMPPSFRFPAKDVEVWTPMQFHPEMKLNRVAHFLRVVARLNAGVSQRQAQVEMDAIVGRLEQQYPVYNAHTGVTLVPLHHQFTEAASEAILALSIGVGLVLLIGCANIANLLLARSAARQREMAVRAALGAPRSRLVRQLLTESVLLSTAGAAFGLFFALWSTGFLSQFVPNELGHVSSVSLDLRAFAFTIALSAITAFGFGLAPALQSSRIDLGTALKQAAQTLSRDHSRTRSILVVVEVCIAVVLLTGAALLVRSFSALRRVDLGFRPDHLLTMRIVPPASKYGALAARVQFYKHLLERVRSVPGVQAAGMISFLPLSLKGGTEGIAVEGRSASGPGGAIETSYRVVTPEYFHAMGMPIKKGRSFEERDNETAGLIAVINETMASRCWPAEDALGKRLRINDPRQKTPWITVVGIVGDVRQWALDDQPWPEIYVPCAQRREYGYRPQDLVVRTNVDPLLLAGAVRREIWAVDKEQPVANVSTMNIILSEELAPRRVQMLLLASFALGALLLAALGLYGVISYSVVQRTQEIGVRMALGAQQKDVLRLVAREAVLLALTGVVFGLLGAFALTRFLATLLYSVQPTDPATFAGVSILLTAVALVASYIPARRAARVDPIVALRCE